MLRIVVIIVLLTFAAACLAAMITFLFLINPDVESKLSLLWGYSGGTIGLLIFPMIACIFTAARIFRSPP